MFEFTDEQLDNMFKHGYNAKYIRALELQEGVAQKVKSGGRIDDNDKKLLSEAQMLIDSQNKPVGLDEKINESFKSPALYQAKRGIKTAVAITADLQKYNIPLRALETVWELSPHKAIEHGRKKGGEGLLDSFVKGVPFAIETAAKTALNKNPDSLTSTAKSYWDKELKDIHKAQMEAERITGIETPVSSQLVGMLTNPYNFIGSLKVGFGVKEIIQRFLINSAAGGAVSGYESYKFGESSENIAKSAAFGAIGSGILGEVIHGVGYAAKNLYLSSAKRRLDNAANDAERTAINEEIRDIESRSPQESVNNIDVVRFIDKNTNGNIVLREQILEDLAQGREKPSNAGVSQETYDEARYLLNLQRESEELFANNEIFNNLDNELKKIQDETKAAGEESLASYAALVKEYNTIKESNPHLNDAQAIELVNNKYKPTENEIFISNAINDGIQVDNRLSGFRIVHALEKSIELAKSGLAKTPEDIAASLKKAGFGDEQVDVFIKAYTSGDINIAKDYINQKIKAGGIKTAVEKSGVAAWLKTSKEQKALQKEKRGIWNVTFNGKNAAEIRMDDLGNVIRYEQGSQGGGAIHIVRKHLGDGKYGELTPEELLNMGEIIRKGEMPENLVRIFDNGVKSYAYELTKDGIRYRVAVMENGDGKKVVTMYSNKNTEEASPVSYLKSSPDNNIIPKTKENVKPVDSTTEHSDKNTKTPETADGTLKPSADSNIMAKENVKPAESKADEVPTSPKTEETLKTEEYPKNESAAKSEPKEEPKSQTAQTLETKQVETAPKVEQIPEVKPETKLKKNEVEYETRNVNGSREKVVGERIKTSAKGFEDVEFAVRKSESGLWHIDDIQTGYKISDSFKTKKEALLQFNERLAKVSKEKYDKLVKQKLNEAAAMEANKVTFDAVIDGKHKTITAQKLKDFAKGFEDVEFAIAGDKNTNIIFDIKSGLKIGNRGNLREILESLGREKYDKYSNIIAKARQESFEPTPETKSWNESLYKTKKAETKTDDFITNLENEAIRLTKDPVEKAKLKTQIERERIEKEIKIAEERFKEANDDIRFKESDIERNRYHIERLSGNKKELDYLKRQISKTANKAQKVKLQKLLDERVQNTNKLETTLNENEKKLSIYKENAKYAQNELDKAKARLKEFEEMRYNEDGSIRTPLDGAC